MFRRILTQEDDSVEYVSDVQYITLRKNSENKLDGLVFWSNKNKPLWDFDSEKDFDLLMDGTFIITSFETVDKHRIKIKLDRTYEVKIEDATPDSAVIMLELRSM